MGVYRLSIESSSETLGAVELTGIARGYLAADRMLKKAPVRLLDARPYCPGKFLILVTGDVASIEESLAVGIAAAEDSLFGQLFIPNLMPAVVAAINRGARIGVKESVGILESFSALALIDAVNEAVKAVDVAVESISLLQGLGGKAFAVLSGVLADVEAAADAGKRRIPRDMFVGSQILSQVSRELVPFLPGSERHVHG